MGTNGRNIIYTFESGECNTTTLTIANSAPDYNNNNNKNKLLCYLH